MKTNRLFWATLIVVALITAAGGFVRYLVAVNDLIWLDELHTSWAVKAGVGDVFGRAAIGNQTPVFFWLTWPFYSLLEPSALSLRMVALVSGVGTIMVVGGLVFRWTESFLGAVVAALLVSLDVQFLYYATEARPYSLVQFLSVVQVGLFWSSLAESAESAIDDGGNAKPSSIWNFGWVEAGLVLASACLFYTHVTSAWLFIVEVMFAAIWMIFSSSFRAVYWRTAICSAVAFGLFCLPILFHVNAVFGRRSNWSNVSSIRGVLEQQFVHVALWIVIPLAALLFTFVIRLITGRFRSTSDKNIVEESRTNERFVAAWQPRLVFTLAWALAPILAVVLVDYLRVAPMALTRYTLVGAAAMPVFAGLVIGELGNHGLKIGLAVLLIATSLFQSPITSSQFVQSGFQVAQLPMLRTENWESPIGEINFNEAKYGQPIFLLANLIEDVEAFENRDPKFQEYLLFPIDGIYEINQPREKPLPQLIACPTEPLEHLRADDIQKIKTLGGCWVIIRGTKELAFEMETEIITKSKQLFPNAGTLKVDRYQTPGSDVYLLSLDW